MKSALLKANGLTIDSKQRNKTALIFDDPETVKNLIELFKDTDARRLEVSGKKVSILIVQSKDKQISSPQIADVLETLDKFARLLEFLAEEQPHPEN